MKRQLPIDSYAKDFPTLYGLDIGEYYEVLEDFFLEIVEGYKNFSEKHNVKYLKPEWSRIRVIPEDLIVVNHTDAFLLPRDEGFFIQCRPESTGEDRQVIFDKFPTDLLEKIGKDVVRAHSMGIEDRKKFTLSRIL